MNKLAIFLVAMLSTGYVYAGGNNNTGGDSCRGNCPSGGGQVSSSNTNVQGQDQGQQQGQEANSSSNANSSAVSNSQGGAGGLGGEGGQGGVASASVAEGAVQTTSNPSASSEGGSANNSYDAGDISFSSNYENEESASTAASVYADQCQVGVSGQGVDGGGSLVVSDGFCDHIKAAKEAYNTFEREQAICERWPEYCDKELVAKSLQDSRDNMADAMNLVERSEWLAYINRGASQMVIPGLLIFVLFLL